MRLKELLPLIDEFSEVSIVKDGSVVEWYMSKLDVNKIYYSKIIASVGAYGDMIEIEVK